MRHASTGSANLVAGLAFGALIGGVTALLLAPRSGKESIQSLRAGMGAVRTKLGALAYRRREEFREDPADSGKEERSFYGIGPVAGAARFPAAI